MKEKETPDLTLSGRTKEKEEKLREGRKVQRARSLKRERPFFPNHPETKVRAYGNSAGYLVARLRRDHPEIEEALARGEYPSGRAAAIAAGIIRVPSAEDAQMERLLREWTRSSLEDRMMFLALVDEEVEAAQEGRFLSLIPVRRPYWWDFESPTLPDLTFLVNVPLSLSDIARRIDVDVRTVRRWVAGTAKPREVQKKKLSLLRETVERETVGSSS